MCGGLTVVDTADPTYGVSMYGGLTVLATADITYGVSMCGGLTVVATAAPHMGSACTEDLLWLPLLTPHIGSMVFPPDTVKRSLMQTWSTTSGPANIRSTKSNLEAHRCKTQKHLYMHSIKNTGMLPASLFTLKNH